MTEQDKDKNVKVEKRNNAKADKQSNVKTAKNKENFDEHFKGTAVDPDREQSSDLNAEQEVPGGDGSESHSVEVTEAEQQVVESVDVDETNSEQQKDSSLIKQDEVSKTLAVEQGATQTNKVKYTLLTLALFLAGFLLGQYYETSSRNTVYVLDEVKFLKLASVGIATSDQDKVTSGLSEGDKKKVKDTVSQVNKILSEQYSRYPVLIQKRNKKGYEVYNLARRIDITVPVLIQLIGEEKWLEIGKVLK